VADREVLAFDLYGTLVDPIAVSSELDQVLGGSDGAEVARLWRLKQLEYSFRLTAMGHYEDFRWVTSRALDFALSSTGAELPGDQTRRLIELYDHLGPFPDAVPALRALAGLGYELVVLSNGSPAMMRNCLANSGSASSSASGSAPTRSGPLSRRPSCTGTRPSGWPRRSAGSALLPATRSTASARVRPECARPG
jgi:2-haloalkanoic acid dehalogenase type II